MTEVWDVVVVGLGPAGAATAYRAASLGLRVLAVDRAVFPRDKVCGCCVSRRALPYLEALGVLTTVRSSAVPLNRAELRASRTRAVLPLPTGLVISRRDLDHALVQKVRDAGVIIVTGCDAHLGACGEAYRDVFLRRPGESPCLERARAVVLADGIAGTGGQSVAELKPHRGRRSRFGAACCLADGDSWQFGWVYLAYAGGEYLGITRLADGRIQVAGAWRFRGSVPPSLSTRAERILRQCDLPVPISLHKAIWKGTPPFGATRTPTAPRVLVVGDAAGYIEPITGEGIALALEGGWHLGQMLALHRGWTPTLAQTWHRFSTQTLSRRQRWARWISWLLDHPGLVRRAIQSLACWPVLAHWLVGQLHGPVFPAPENPGGHNFSSALIRRFPGVHFHAYGSTSRLG